jgi:hypothetical protein
MPKLALQLFYFCRVPYVFLSLAATSIQMPSILSATRFLIPFLNLRCITLKPPLKKLHTKLQFENCNFVSSLLTPTEQANKKKREREVTGITPVLPESLTM